MRFNELQQAWEELGEKDPLWAVLTVDEMKGNKWNPEAFFETGVAFTAEAQDWMQRVGLPTKGTRALDFGCGVGRLTQALAANYDRVTGVDISAPMIDKAKTFNKFGDRVDYLDNPKDDLSVFPTASFDYVQTFIVLQHMHPSHQAGYLREFARILKPDGVLVFQIPCYDRRPNSPDQVDGLVTPEEVRDGHVGMRMFVTPMPLVCAILDEQGVDVVASHRDELCGPDFSSFTYYCVRRTSDEPKYRAVDGFAAAMQRMVMRTSEVVLQDSRYVGVSLKSVSSEDPAQNPVYAQFEALRKEHEAVVNSKVWRVGRHLAAILHRFKGSS